MTYSDIFMASLHMKRHLNLAIHGFRRYVPFGVLGKGRYVSLKMSTTRVVPSLFCQCKLYFLMHVEEFSVTFLSLLPVSVREELLWRLPVADVCLLEDTNFVEDLDMEVYWTLSCGSTLTELLSEDGESFFEEWGKTEFAKACFYGQLVRTTVLRGFNEPLLVGIDRNTQVELSGGKSRIIPFLYTVRKVLPVDSGANSYRLTYPPRYAKFNVRNSTVGQLIGAMVNCFRCKLPKVLPKGFIKRLK